MKKLIFYQPILQVPNRHLFWSRQADMRNVAVTQCGMTLNRFKEIMRSLHFANDLGHRPEAGDSLYKVRPLFDHFNKLFLEIAQPLPMTWAIDEVMEPYYSRHGFKQFIRGRPIRFGFKFWCLCSQEGYLLKFKLFEGKDEELLTVEDSVVHALTHNVVPPNSYGYIGEHLTTLPLLESFSQAGINLTGIIREERAKGVPFSDTSKQHLGAAEAFQEKEKYITVCCWKDYDNVIIVTNRRDNIPFCLGKCKRWPKQLCNPKVVSQPILIQNYNQGMKGVEAFDQLRGKYRVSFRKRVWYYPIFRFILNASIVNGWLLYRKIHNITQLDFTRQVVNVLLKPSAKAGRTVPLRTFDAARFDGVGHDIVKGSTQRRCGVCKKCAKPKCTKCDVALHVQCWVEYHTR